MFTEFKNACANFFKEQNKYLYEISNIMGEGLEVYDTG